MAEQQSKREKVVSIATAEAVTVAGMSRTHISVNAEWAKVPGLGLELEQAGGMGVWVRWNQRSGTDVFRHKALVAATQITFEPTPQ